MNDAVWVFGYGSLASPVSVARTIGRPVVRETDLVVALLDGYGRRWNYGSLQLRGDWHHDGTPVRNGVVISLGLVAAAGERVNGALVRVTPTELAELDWRERDYERTDVTDLIRPEAGDAPVRGTVVTYVPRPSAIDRYRQARDDRRAAVRRSYWDLVHEAFGAFGAGHLDHFARTPPPDVPVVDVTLTAPR